MRLNRRSNFARLAALLVASISNAMVTPTSRELMAAGMQPCEVLPIPSEPYYAPDDIWLLRGVSLINDVRAELPNDCI
ncbi:MAG TPA: hypothetical protein VGX27_00870 [Candidatus Dormibacteraeota bacterium]|nr:hypothetical protein [Candidatus Dormibacteraeota bacterium]